MADMLVLAKVGVRKTRLVYGANLNFNIVNKYLDLLTSKNMIHKVNDSYFTTPRGEIYLTNYNELIGFLSTPIPEPPM